MVDGLLSEELMIKEKKWLIDLVVAALQRGVQAMLAALLVGLLDAGLLDGAAHQALVGALHELSFKSSAAPAALLLLPLPLA